MRGNNNQIGSLMTAFIIAAIGISILQEFSSFGSKPEPPKTQNDPVINQNP